MLHAHYFDGHSTRVRVVSLSAEGTDLVVAGEGVDIRVPLAGIKIDERLGRAPRRLRFNGGAFCEVRDLDALDGLLSSLGHRDRWVDRLQRHVQFVLFSVVACALLAVAAYRWLLPWAAAQGANRLPAAVVNALSQQTLNVLDGAILKPTKIAAKRQEALRSEFHALHLPRGGNPESPLLFRGSPQLGANAFTLPNGNIILLDDLITLLGDDQQIMAVLAHELGHVRGRDSLQLLLRSSAVGAFWTFYVGDISSLLAAAPAALVQAKYSQDLERQADDYAAALLLQNGMSPALLAAALDKLAKSKSGAGKGGYLSSHPSTDERMSHLRRLGARSAVQ
jgi:Zn-dependent protease with chaperone function